MALVVQKYGGTSVGNADRIKNVAARVAEARRKGDQIVVVVSAMSGVTDGLLNLAKEIMPAPPERELDVLLATGEQTTIALTAMALHAIGVPAVSLTGRAGRHRHRRRAHEGEDQEHHAQGSAPAARCRQRRHRRRLSGADERRADHDARARRLGPDGDRAGRGAQGRPLPDLHRRRRRLHRRSAHRAGRAQARRDLLRRDARARRVGREGHAAALGRDRQEVRRRLRSALEP